MTCLIIDTAGKEGMLALAQAGRVVQTISLPQGRDLSKVLFSSLPSFVDLKFDFIAVGQGPGSFTGTRVGAMLAQALSFGWKIPLVGFSSTLLPNLAEIAATAYSSFLSGQTSSQIELVYISPRL